MTNWQEAYHTDDFDYLRGSPHLKHVTLYRRLVATVRSVLGDVFETLPMDVLEIGAGHGGYTEPVLALGGRVTAVEMSRPSCLQLQKAFEWNDRFCGVYDPSGDLSPVSGEFSAVLCIAVLHHIPDYLGYLTEATKRLRKGGVLLTLQDPLWYPRVPKATRRADRLAYYAWRCRQGNARQAARTLIRRCRRVYDEENSADMVEYHVVRSGVNEVAIVDQLRSEFEETQVVKYWSTQSALGQRTGVRMGMVNTFGIIARGKQ
jgi:SAM-dependent methyltransferase